MKKNYINFLFSEEYILYFLSIISFRSFSFIILIFIRNQRYFGLGSDRKTSGKIGKFSNIRIFSGSQQRYPIVHISRSRKRFDCTDVLYFYNTAFMYNFTCNLYNLLLYSFCTPKIIPLHKDHLFSQDFKL